MRWPLKVRHRKNGPVLARVYPPCEGRESYRVAWRAAGRRQMRSFPRFAGTGGAREFAESLAAELTQGSQVPFLSPKQAQDALAIRDLLADFQMATGRRVSAVEAVTGFLAAARLLPADLAPVEAVRTFARTLSHVKPMDIREAVAGFLLAREEQPKARGRARFSPVYARNVASWLTGFAEAFPGHLVADLTPELLGAYFTGFRELSEKARNDRRATLGMWLRWCGRKDYLPEPQLTKLLRSDELKKEQLQPGTIAFYEPGELRRVLDAIRDPANRACRDQSRDALLAVTVLQAFGGARLEEALRLRWEDLSQNPEHVEIAGLRAKTRQRRLLVVVPTLALWLTGFRGRSGPIWAAPVNSFVTEWARVRTSAGVPSKRNGLRHAFVSYSYVLRGEVETSVLAGTSPQILHANYRGLATKQEAEAWFAVRPHTAENLVPFPARQTP